MPAFVHQMNSTCFTISFITSFFKKESVFSLKHSLHHACFFSILVLRSTAFLYYSYFAVTFLLSLSLSIHIVLEKFFVGFLKFWIHHMLVKFLFKIPFGTPYVYHFISIIFLYFSSIQSALTTQYYLAVHLLPFDNYTS